MYRVHIFVNTSDIATLLERFGTYDIIDLTTYSIDDDKSLSFSLVVSYPQLLDVTRLIERYDIINFSFYKE